MTDKARRIVRELFDAFWRRVRCCHRSIRQRLNARPARTVADYIAGMTDRYAAKEHRRLFGAAPARLPEQSLRIDRRIESGTRSAVYLPVRPKG